MSDENASGTELPPATPAPRGAFDWLVESHQQSAPMAPLTDDIPAPAPARSSFDLPNPAAPPAQAARAPSFPGLLTPQEPVAAPPPAQTAPPAPPQPFAFAPVAAPPVQQPAIQPPPAQPPLVATEAPPITPASAVFAFDSEPLAPSTFGGGLGPSSLGLERHERTVRSGNGPLDWVAFVLAFLAPPIGLVLGIAAVVTSSRTKGYAASIAKAAIGIGAALSLVLGVAFVVESKLNADRAAHEAIVASSVAYCSKLKSNPATLNSDTFGWPAPADTIPQSITAIKGYEAYWESLVKLAPAGIRADTLKFADTAKSIASNVQSTQTLNDTGNVAQLQNLVVETGIKGWVSNYCN